MELEAILEEAVSVPVEGKPKLLFFVTPQQPR